MRKNTAISILVIINILLLAYIYSLYSKLADLKADRDDKEFRLLALEKEQKNRPKLDFGSNPSTARTALPANNPPALLPPSHSNTPLLSALASGQAALLRLAAAPETAKVTRDYIKSLQWGEYRALLSNLNLPDAKREILQDLLAERFIAQLKTPVGGEKQNEFISRTNAEFKAKAQELVGPEAATLSMDALEHPNSWAQLSQFEDRLRTLGVQDLTLVQSAAALEAIGASLQRIPAGYDPKVFEAFEVSKKQQNASVVAQLTNILTPEQLQVLSRKLDDNLVGARINVLVGQMATTGRKK